MAPRPSKPISSLIVVAILTTLLVGALDAAVLYRTSRQVAATAFPTTPGRVTHAAVTTHDREEREDGQVVTRRSYGADIRFEYEVDGRRHAARGHRYGYSPQPRRSPAARVVARYPRSASVTVHYDPDDPARAVLEVGASAPERWLTGVLAPANVALVGLWGWGMMHTARARRRPVAGGARIVRRGDRLHVRLPRFGTAHLAWGMAMWTAIAGVFVVALWAGSNPIATLGVVMAGAALAAGATVAWRRSTWRAGRWLVIDPVTREMRLPLTFGRREPVVVPFDAIEAIRSIAAANDHFEPSIAWRGPDGAAESETLAQWAEEDRATALVDWLREQVT